MDHCTGFSDNVNNNSSSDTASAQDIDVVDSTASDTTSNASKEGFTDQVKVQLTSYSILSINWNI